MTAVVSFIVVIELVVEVYKSCRGPKVVAGTFMELEMKMPLLTCNPNLGIRTTKKMMERQRQKEGKEEGWGG
jgi:hypothetical protein